MNLLTHTEKLLFKCIHENRYSKFVDTYESSEFIKKDSTNEEGRTFLGDAVARGSEKIMSYLLKDKELAAMEDSNNKLFTFYLSKPQNKKMLFSLMVKEKVDFSQISSENKNILHFLAPFDNGELFEKASSLGADKEMKDIRGFSPMDVAKRYRNINLLNLSDIDSPIFK
jgi:ankyrin repeat protein